MEINSDNSEVMCPSCGDHWPIWSSSYYCSCGYVFSATEVSVEVEAIVANAKLIANELRRSMETRNRISAITDKVIADVAAGFWRESLEYTKKINHSDYSSSKGLDWAVIPIKSIIWSGKKGYNNQ